jgi:hypothetical protein
MPSSAFNVSRGTAAKLQWPGSSADVVDADVGDEDVVDAEGVVVFVASSRCTGSSSAAAAITVSARSDNGTRLFLRSAEAADDVVG